MNGWKYFWRKALKRREKICRKRGRNSKQQVKPKMEQDDKERERKKRSKK